MTSITHVSIMLFKEWHSNLSESVAGGPATGRLQVQVGFGTQSESMRGKGRYPSAGLVITLNYGRPGPTDKGCMVRDNEHSRIFIRLNRFLCTPTCFVLTCFPLISAGEGELHIVQSLMLNSVNCILIVRRLSTLRKIQRIPPIIPILIQDSIHNISRCRLRTLHESLF